MKKQCYIIILLFVCLFKFSTAQILCIYCYDQNDTISAGVNNLLLNGGFENTTCPAYPPLVTFCPNSTQYPHCSIANWICTGGGTDTYAFIMYDTTLLTYIAEGTKAAYFGNSFCQACSSTVDDTSCLNNTFCTVGGIPLGYPMSGQNLGGVTGVSLEQTINGLVAGTTYILEFWAGGESTNNHFIRKGLFAVDVGFGDTLLRDKVTEPVSGIGTRYIVEFNATSSSHTIKFTNWGHICDSCTELVLDDVRLYTLAELSPLVPHCILGINDASVSLNIISISPNPFSDKLNFTVDDNKSSEIILYDIASRKLLQKKFINSVSLNTEQLAKGLYLYEVRNKNGVLKKGKVVKD